MQIAGWITLLYGIIILLGGIMGHVKAASKASLIMGLICGALLIGASILIFRKIPMGFLIALILTFALDAFFTYRFFITMKFMPAGLMSIISLAALISLALTRKS